MTRIACYRSALIMLGLTIAAGSLPAKSPAALDMSVGIRRVVKTSPVSACNSSAKTALDAVLTDAQENGSGTGLWQAYGAPDGGNGSTASAAIHCYPLEPGYLVTFTCATQVPPSADSAGALCDKLVAAFDAGGR